MEEKDDSSLFVECEENRGSFDNKNQNFSLCVKCAPVSC